MYPKFKNIRCEKNVHLKKKFIFNWRIIASQCCAGFCHTSTWIITRYKSIPSLLNFPPISHIQPHPSGLSQSTRPNSLSNSPFKRQKLLMGVQVFNHSHPSYSKKTFSNYAWNASVSQHLPAIISSLSSNSQGGTAIKGAQFKKVDLILQ